jgi:hypothetical protein
MTRFASLLFLLVAAPALAQHAGHGTPYAGLQQREIKALSAEDTQGLLRGAGMSLALPAELNGYPGPQHVLEHADALQLSPEQRSKTQALLAAHKVQARELGQRIVDAERTLDTAFRTRSVNADQVRQMTTAIAALQGELRAAHLQTHLEQTALLTRHQVARYQQLRGYASASHGGHQ